MFDWIGMTTVALDMHVGYLWGAAMLLSLALVTDMRNRKIPNKLTVAFLLVGLCVHVAASGFEGILHSLAGAAAGLAPLYFLYTIGAVGAGDAKLFAAVGAWVGWQAVCLLLVASLLYAGAIGLIVWAWKRRLKGEQIPFMLAVFPAALTLWLGS